MFDLAQFAKDVKDAKTDDALSKVNRKYDKDDLKKAVPSLTPKDWPQCEEVIVALLEKCPCWMFGEFACPLMEKKKIIDWKKRTDVIERFFEVFWSSVGLEDDFDRRYTDFFESLFKILKSNKLIKQFQKQILMVIERSLTTYSDNYEHCIHAAAMQCAIDYTWKDDIVGAKKTFQLLSQAVQKHPEVPDGAWLYTAMNMSSCMIFQSMRSSAGSVTNVLAEVTEIFHFCKDQEWDVDGDRDKHTISYELLKSIMEDYLNGHNTMTEILKPNMDVVKELWECGDEILERDANYVMTAVATNVELLGDNTDDVIDKYLNGENPQLITSFHTLYKDCPEKFHPRLDDFFDIVTTQDEWISMSSLSLFSEIAKANPSVFTTKHLDALALFLKGENTVHLTFPVMQCLAEKRPKDLVKYDDAVLAAMKRLGQMGSGGAGFLVAVAKCGEKQCRKYLKFLASTIPKVQSMYQVGLLYNMRSIGQQHLPALAEYKDFIVKLKADAALVDSCQSLLDLIEGRSLEGISKDVDDAKQDIDELDDRVTTTEQNVENVSREVDGTKKDIKHIKEDVTKVEGRVDELEEVVDETVEKVEDIDRKTLSHAPAWSRDVSVLMNPEREHDWRLLASRLGYTAEDVRNWATQPDPCLSLLDEWFATHKTREATFAVLKGLQEMNRMDAAAIVEKALANVEDVIDEEPEELVEPPPVFISYQWGHQAEAKLLKRHLEMAGFKAWMDIGQMGGGDKLFAKIDQGIRAAKVVIGCVSEKYAQSPNCNREVNLSVTLGKPLIPLLMENLSWPPPGAMGPIFGEYLFIRFFARKGEESGDERYWPVPKFQELLMQLRYSIVPENDLITQEYKGWWDPPDEMIVIKPKEEKQPGKSSSGEAKGESKEVVKNTSPDIFISYQWGKQPQIKKLFGRLTSMGFSCWLDIMQMGGGDSLYDKIDKGVRGCKVVLTCVTTKYSISANCRREVSLADALKKPIVPLLLETMTWPPEGPMGMVLTQLLYINFCKPDADIQNHWECPQFEELLGQIRLQGLGPITSNGQKTKASNYSNNLPQKENQGSNKNTKHIDTKPAHEKESKAPKGKNASSIKTEEKKVKSDKEEGKNAKSVAKSTKKHEKANDKGDEQKQTALKRVNERAKSGSLRHADVEEHAEKDHPPNQHTDKPKQDNSPSESDHKDKAQTIDNVGAPPIVQAKSSCCVIQ